MYWIYRVLFRGLGLMPWCVLQGMSQLLGLLLHRVLRYRRAVVYSNLERSFPTKSKEEVAAIARDFYTVLTFQFLTTPKFLSLTPETIMRHHLRLEGLEVLQTLGLLERKACIVLMGHCGHWELFSAGQIYFAPLGYQQEQLYRPLTNKALDRLFLEMRSRYGSINTPKSDIGRALVRLLQSEVSHPHILAFIADQTPRKGVECVWTDFLNQPTAFLDGAERLARKFDLPVLYMDIEPVTTTKFVGRLTVVSATPRLSTPGSITESYANMLEKTIQAAPAYWLWSHKRWKFAPINSEKYGES